MSSSLMPNHLFNSQESPITRPGLQSENERLKLLLDMTNVLVSNLKCRDVASRGLGNHTTSHALRCRRGVGAGFGTGPSAPTRYGLPRKQWIRDGGFGATVEGSIVGRVFKTGKPIVLDVIGEQVAPRRLAKFTLKPSSPAALCL